MTSSSYDYLFKYIVIGDSGVGKSCLLLRYTDNSFNQIHDLTIGVEFGSKVVHINNLKIKLNVFDTAGQESFRSITRSYYRNTAVAIFVFDITRRETFNHIRSWMNDFKINNSNPHAEMILVGNKCDMEHRRKVSTEEGRALASELGIKYFEEASNKIDKNVKNVFEMPAKVMIEKIQNNPSVVSEAGDAIRRSRASTREHIKITSTTESGDGGGYYSLLSTDAAYRNASSSCGNC